MIPQILLSLDYELFFGHPVGTVERCLIEPTEEAARVVRRYGAYLSLFVDALYLQRLSEESSRFPQLQKELDAIRRQLARLKAEGHDVQMHLHPHWLDSRYDGGQWRLDTRRYKLHDFCATEVSAMVGSAQALLLEVVGETVFAFRAGGWCLQPFPQIAPALLAHGVWLDSTVFAGGVSDDLERWFDFTAAPVADYWLFGDDPSSENQQGPFVEIPISAMQVSPVLFWRMAIARKLLAKAEHQPFGDGAPLSWGKKYYFNRLTRATISVASMDGFKAGCLSQVFRTEAEKGKHLFHAMGHPKALSRYSLAKLESFLDGLDTFHGVTFQDFRHLRPEGRSGVVAGTNQQEAA